MYADVALPLTHLTRPSQPFLWSSSANQSFQYLKHRLTTAPILITPDKDWRVYYASRLLNKAEQNYSTTKREGLAIVYALQKFCHYLLANKFTVITDHHALRYLINKPLVAERVWRWLLLFQEFDFEVMLSPGKSHVRRIISPASLLVNQPPSALMMIFRIVISF